MTTETDDGWPGYARTLAALHRERDAALQTYRTACRAQADHAAELQRLTDRQTAQQHALIDLSARLRAPLGPDDLRPARVPTLEPDAGLAELRALVDATDQAVAAARQTAVLPQLLPAWKSPFARAAVVYAAFAMPSLLLTVVLSLAGVGEDRAALLVLAVIWPAVTAVAGGMTVARVSRARVADDLTFEPERRAATGAGLSQVEALLVDRLRRRDRRYPWFGVLLAWASWLVPGAALDYLGSMWGG